MKRSGYIVAAAIVGFILSFPLLFAFVRTAKVFTWFEPREGTLWFSGETLGNLAAVTVDLSVVGFIIGWMVAGLMASSKQRTALRWWCGGGMAGVLLLQTAISFLMSGLAGWRDVSGRLERAGVDADLAWHVSLGMWILVSLFIPFIVLALSELMASLIRLAILAPSTVAQPQASEAQASATVEEDEPDDVDMTGREQSIRAINDAYERQAQGLEVDTPFSSVRFPAPSMWSKTTIYQPAPGTVDVVALHEVDGLSFTEIGKRLGVSRQAAGAQYTRAKRAQAVASNGHLQEVTG